MDTSNIGSDSASDSNPSLRQSPDFSAALERLRGSVRAWEQLLAEGKVEPLVLQWQTPAGVEGIPNRMLTERELRQSRINNWLLDRYYTRILRTPPKLD
jgi:hypothetical protein